MIIKQNVYDLDSLRLESSVVMCSMEWKLYKSMYEHEKMWTNFHGKFPSSAQINISASECFFPSKWKRKKKIAAERKKIQQSGALGLYVFYTGKIYGLYYKHFFSTRMCIKRSTESSIFIHAEAYLLVAFNKVKKTQKKALARELKTL